MLSKSWHLATFFNIPVKIHWSFLLMGLYVVLIGWKESMDTWGMLGFGGFVLLLFVCVLLHEYGHALTARKYGVETKDIIISPIGGMARLMSIPRKPIQEFWIALMGPAVNVVIAIILAIIIYFSGLTWLPEGTPTTFFNDWKNMPSMLMGINIGLVIFNMIPAFPMDGGRVLRALLAFKLHRVKATRIASFIGQGLAVAFIAFGIYQGEYILPFIGVFVFMTATYEFRSVKQFAKAEETTAGSIARKDYPVLFLHDPIDRAHELYLNKGAQSFIVLDASWQAIGILPEIMIEQSLEHAERPSWVAQYMIPGIQKVKAEANIHEMIDLIHSSSKPLLLVYREDQCIGIVDRNDIQNHLYG
jgi:Zn-dependent protease